MNTARMKDAYAIVERSMKRLIEKTGGQRCKPQNSLYTINILPGNPTITLPALNNANDVYTLMVPNTVVGSTKVIAGMSIFELQPGQKIEYSWQGINITTP